MKKTLLLLVIIITFKSYSQHLFDFSLSAGISRINSLSLNMDDSYISESQAKIEDFNKSSFKSMFNYSYSFNKWKVKTGLGYDLIQGLTKEWVYFYPLPIGSGYEYLYEQNKTIKANYLTIPVVISHKFDKLEIGFGFYGRYLINNSVSIYVYQNSSSYIYQSGGNTLEKFDFGLNGEISYKLDKKYELLISASSGMVDISNGTETGILDFAFQLGKVQRIQKTRQLLIGLRLEIFKK